MKGDTPMRRLRKVVIGGVLALATALVPLVAGPVPAQAAPVVGFNAGNIISDALFYNGNAMSASEVQNFLNQRVTNCRIGQAGYKPGDPSPSGSGNIIASSCLKDFKMTTQSRAADRYCGAYSGASNETAAQIITKVGKACGISQRVLLIMLEKEQSLVTDDWPVTRQYNYAMGMNCPDSGPNNSANCNADSAGFFLQMYLGARQLQVYKGNPNSFNYKPFQNNRIQWHPNAGCGTSEVYIENWATAALYIYTPYRPNQAALNAGWGTGDSCSSYGNRNFYNFYRSWFGLPSGPKVTGAMLEAWNRYGGASGVLGEPVNDSKYFAANGGGYVQEFAGGALFLGNGAQRATGMSVGPFLINYRNAGYVEGSWGWPNGDASCNLPGGGCTMPFQRGTVAYSPTHGSYLVPSVFANKWIELGGAAGVLGYPTQTPRNGYAGDSAQAFSGGTLTSSRTGVRMLAPEFASFWNSVNGLNTIGAPVSDPVPVAANGGGSSYEFTIGTAWTSPAGTFGMTHGPFRTGYLAAGGPQGSWGWPAGNAACALINSGCYMPFQHGIGMWTAKTGMVLVSQESFDLWNKSRGSILYPVRAPQKLAVNGGGEVQEFELGTVWTSPAGTFGMTHGPFRTGYLAAGGPQGSWGWPAGNAACALINGGCYMPFQNGMGMWSAKTGMVLVSQESFDLWNRSRGSILYPVRAPQKLAVNGGGEVQEFELGTVWTSPAGTFGMTHGPFRTGYLANGGPAGAWGWPIGAANCTLPRGGCKMSFQNGDVTYQDGKFSLIKSRGSLEQQSAEEGPVEQENIEEFAPEQEIVEEDAAGQARREEDLN